MLELLLQDFWEEGLRLYAPPPPRVPALLTRPGLVSLRGGGVPSSPPPPPPPPASGSISALTLPWAACTVRHHGGQLLCVRARGGA